MKEEKIKNIRHFYGEVFNNELKKKNEEKDIERKTD